MKSIDSTLYNAMSEVLVEVGDSLVVDLYSTIICVFDGKELEEEQNFRTFVTFARENNYIYQIDIHTDCKGSSEYSLLFSQTIAEKLKKRLKKLGISKKRIIERGLGSRNTIIDCKCKDCTKEQRNTNRRTTIKIVGFT
ncbi:MAG: OmpA family protein [Bacteroidota bacterium]